MRNRRPTVNAVWFVLVASLAISVFASSSQVSSADVTRKTLKFDFGSGVAAPGFVQVSPTTIYSSERGYGFMQPVEVSPDGTRGGTRTSLCSRNSFRFSAVVPEGNYNASIALGDQSVESVTTVKGEARRLMLEKVRTTPGQTVTRSFTINVRTSLLKSGARVKLKADEQGHLDWDNVLTLEFGDAHPCVRTLEITPVDDAVTVYITGDSTVTDQGKEPYAAWGQMLPRFFQAGVAIANHAESGESLKEFIGEKRLEKVMDTIQPGDYLFVQFTHNDQKPGPNHVDAFTDYKSYLKLYINEARLRGAIPVLVTSMLRRKFADDGKIVNTLEDFPDAMRQTAKEENVPLIDLNVMSKAFYEAMGPENSTRAFVHYPAGTYPGQTTELKDDTHFNAYGAYELAKCIVEGIKASQLGIAKYLVEGLPTFDPAHPDSLESWNLPASPLMQTATPAAAPIAIK
jgi:lysophospholipase L1-like esterase